MKTYAEMCIERAEKATPGPWVSGEFIGRVETEYQPDCCEFYNCRLIVDLNYSSLCRSQDMEAFNCRFIAHAREDVPELANRLKKACDSLAILEGVIRRKMPVHEDWVKELREELERVPE